MNTELKTMLIEENNSCYSLLGVTLSAKLIEMLAFQLKSKFESEDSHRARINLVRDAFYKRVKCI